MKFLARSCYSNFGNKVALLEAEAAALTGKTTLALSRYNTAIKLAKKEGFLSEEGLAYDRLGQYHCILGSVQGAAPFFEGARSAYQRWGAKTLVECMEKWIASLGGSSTLALHDRP
jgi:hypothetical protein